jgi:adenosylmethionine-8-amino-7-oxononanoate aminotransferase
VIAFLGDRLKSFWELKHVSDIRQLGFMVGIELVRDRDGKKLYSLWDEDSYQSDQEARKRGLMIRPLGDVIVIMPFQH